MLLARKLLSLGVLLTLTSAAAAQTRYVDGPWGDGGYHHASTYAEGAQRGFADVVRSAGAYNLMTAEAATVAEDARSKYLDNRLKATNTYFEMRRANEQYRRAEQTPPLTTEQLFRIASERAPDRLSSSELDPLTGELAWPTVLQSPAYEPYRAQLEGLFAERARSGGVAGGSDYFEIRRVAQACRDELKSNIRDYPPSEYLRARNFLESLSYSARIPSG